MLKITYHRYPVVPLHSVSLQSRLPFALHTDPCPLTPYTYMRRLLFIFTLLVFATPIHAQDLSVLQDPAASHFAKTLACKQAAQTGSVECVPALAAVLLDEELSHPARIALLQIPGPEATRALCEALPKAEGDILIGILSTIGDRGDAVFYIPPFHPTDNLSPTAVHVAVHIAPFLSAKDPKTVQAAATALGKIGSTPAQAALLRQSIGANFSSRIPLLIDGILAIAEQQGDIGIYCIQEWPDLPIAARTGAIRGLLLLPDLKAEKYLEEFLTDPDDGVFLAMIGAVRDLESPKATPILLAALPTLDADRQALLFDVLDCRGDEAARATVLEMAKTGCAAHAAAIRALAGMPDNEVIDFLLTTATGENAENAAAAADALSRMNPTVAPVKSPSLEEQIIDALKNASGKSCVPLILVCQNRKIADATPVLLPFLSDAEEDVRLAAIAALGNTVSGETIDVLLALLLNPASETEFKTVQDSLKLVSHRTVDPDAVAEKVLAVYADAALPTKCALIELLGALGGRMAIVVVQNILADPTEQIQDTATRVLGEWPDPDAAPVLLEVLKSEAGERFKIRALRGYIRIVRQMDTWNENRFRMCMEALALAERDEEKSLLVDAMSRIPIRESLAKLSEFIDQPTFAEQASLAAVGVGKAIITQHSEEVAAVMRKIIDTTQNAETRRQAEEVIRK